MKIRKVSSVSLAVLLFATAALVGGCMTSGRDRSIDTSNSIQAVDTDIRKLLTQIDATGTALDSLVMAGQADLDKPFKNYTKSLDKLESDGKRLISRVDELKAHKKEYFAEWEKQGDTFTNPEIRGLSETRRNELAQIYDRVPEASIGIKGSYNAYLNNLQEIQKYLSNDLTPKGVASVIPVAEKTAVEREELKTSLMPVLTALEELKAELNSSKK